MNRKHFLRVSGLAGCGSVLPGCESLKELEKRPEGAGVQLVSGLLIIARYQATPRQRSEAKQKGAKVFLERGLKPAYEKELRVIKTKARPKVERTARSAEPTKAPAAARKAVEVAVSEAVAKDVAKLEASFNVAANQACGDLGLNLGLKPVSSVKSDAVLADRLLAGGAENFSEENLALGIAPANQPGEGPSTETIMAWNTRSHELVGSDAYVVPTTVAGKRGNLDGTRVVFVD